MDQGCPGRRRGACRGRASTEGRAVERRSVSGHSVWRGREAGVRPWWRWRRHVLGPDRCESVDRFDCKRKIAAKPCSGFVPGEDSTKLRTNRPWTSSPALESGTGPDSVAPNRALPARWAGRHPRSAESLDWSEPPLLRPVPSPGPGRGTSRARQRTSSIAVTRPPPTVNSTVTLPRSYSQRWPVPAP